MCVCVLLILASRPIYKSLICLYLSVSLILLAVETLSDRYNSSVVNDLSINSQVRLVSVARAYVPNFEL